MALHKPKEDAARRKADRTPKPAAPRKMRRSAVKTSRRRK